MDTDEQFGDCEICGRRRLLRPWGLYQDLLCAECSAAEAAEAAAEDEELETDLYRDE